MSLPPSLLNSSSFSKNDSLVLHGVIYQQRDNCLDTQSARENNEECFLVDYSVPQNRLYARPDGSIGLAEKPIGFVIGEKVLAPTVEIVSSCTKNIFGLIRNGFGYFRDCLSIVYNFQILPTAEAKLQPNNPDPYKRELLRERCDSQLAHFKSLGEYKQEAFSLFFSLPTIRRCSIQEKEKLKVFIREEDQRNFEAYLIHVFGEDIEELIDRDLDQVKDAKIRERHPDVGSLMYHLFSGRVNTPLAKESSNEEMLKKIEELKDELIEKISADSRFFQAALDYVIENRFSGISESSLPSKYQSLLNEIVHLSKKTHQSKKYQETLLLQAVLEANYRQVLNFSNKESKSLTEAMKLFAQSYSYAREIVGKDIILMLGKTGAGKSTTVASLLGCPLKKMTNSIGRNSFVLGSEEYDRCPKIGLSLTSSETLFVKGYPISGYPDLMIADTPGLGENRGSHFAICAALSIDQTILNARSVKALVITIPLPAFTEDRGNPVVELIRDIEKLVPDIIKEQFESLHILITHQDYYTLQMLGALLQQLSLDEHTNDRKKVWNLIWKMHQAGQVELAPIRAKYHSEKLIKRYAASKGFSTSHFASLLEVNSIKRQFADYIGLTAANWSRYIFQKYLDQTQSERFENRLLAFLDNVISYIRISWELGVVSKSICFDRKQIAVVIKSHWETAKAIDQFAQLLIDREESKHHVSLTEQEDNLIATCRTYREIFKKHQGDFQSFCSRDLNQI